MQVPCSHVVWLPDGCWSIFNVIELKISENTGLNLLASTVRPLNVHVYCSQNGDPASLQLPPLPPLRSLSLCLSRAPSVTRSHACSTGPLELQTSLEPSALCTSHSTDKTANQNRPRDILHVPIAASLIPAHTTWARIYLMRFAHHTLTRPGVNLTRAGVRPGVRGVTLAGRAFRRERCAAVATTMLVPGNPRIAACFLKSRCPLGVAAPDATSNSLSA